MRRLLYIPFAFSSLLFVPAVAAETAATPLAWPPGYFNARTATDPKKPEPATTPGELKLARTHHSISIEWHLEGDTDHDAACRVSYKRADESVWHDAMPLLRVDYFGWYDQRNATRPFNMMAGSILFLRPGAEYEVKLRLTDPDLARSVEETRRIRTKPWPAFTKPARQLHVSPIVRNGATGDGSASRPFQGLGVALAAAKPGDLFLLHTGDYGEATIAISGAAGPDNSATDTTRYIGFKSAGDGPVVFRRITPQGSHLWFDGLTFQRVTESSAMKPSGACENVVVQNCKFRDYHYSLHLSRESSGWHIANNDIVGDTVKGISGEGIELNQSPDHTVCYNRVSRSADGISYPLTNCDLFGNDIFDMSDDGIEPDYGYANVRIWGNRLHGHAGITFQSMLCGPWYIVRNHIISTGNAFKLRVQDRFVVVNNTIASWTTSVPHAHGLLTAFSRNNIWMQLGGTGYIWDSTVQDTEKFRSYVTKYVLYDATVANWKTDVDYDGFEFSAGLTSPKHPVATPWSWGGRRFADLASFNAAVGIEAHGRLLDRSRDFETFALAKDTPGEKTPLLKITARSQAKDAGEALPNLAEEFNGKSPDLGAFELGSVVPHYGPRKDPGVVPLEWVLKHQR